MNIHFLKLTLHKPAVLEMIVKLVLLWFPAQISKRLEIKIWIKLYFLKVS